MIRQRFTVRVDGCDDSTVVEIDLDSQEREIIGYLAHLITEEAADSGCKPDMRLTPVGVDD